MEHQQLTGAGAEVDESFDGGAGAARQRVEGTGQQDPLSDTLEAEPTAQPAAARATPDRTAPCDV